MGELVREGITFNESLIKTFAAQLRRVELKVYFAGLKGMTLG